MDGLQLTESEVVNEWIRLGYERSLVPTRRESLLLVLDERFPNALSDQERAAIEHENRADVLRNWFRVSVRARTFDEFRAALNG